MFRAALLLFFLAAFAGCCCPSTETIEHIDTQAAAHDGAARLIEATLSGSLKGDKAADNVTREQLDKTPGPVRRLLRRSIRLNYESRESWHVLRFTMGNGPEVSTLGLSTPPSLGSGSVLDLPSHPATPGGPQPGE
jgi:hypothetical protein